MAATDSVVSYCVTNMICATSWLSKFCLPTSGSCVATAESIFVSCGIATSWSSIFRSSVGGSCAATAESVAGCCGAATS